MIWLAGGWVTKACFRLVAFLLVFAHILRNFLLVSVSARLLGKKTTAAWQGGRLDLDHGRALG